MTNKKHTLWTEKYRPQTLKEYTFHDKDHKRKFTKMVKDKMIPHLLLSGVQGSGKTAISQILMNELNMDPGDVLVINGSDETGVDAVRDIIKSFVSTYSMGKFKVVRIEEADYLSRNAQATLRVLMEQYSEESRFILTCNYVNKIIPAVKSRCQHYTFKAHDKNQVAELAANILISEGIELDIDDLELLDAYVAIGYPDIRKIINILQENTSDGKLFPPSLTSSSGDYKFKLLESINSGNWTEIRNIACAEVSPGEWEEVYRFLYENIQKCLLFETKEKWEAGIVIIADHLYKHGVCADPEINAAAMFIRLGNL